MSETLNERPESSYLPSDGRIIMSCRLARQRMRQEPERYTLVRAPFQERKYAPGFGRGFVTGVGYTCHHEALKDARAAWRIIRLLWLTDAGTSAIDRLITRPKSS
jgi:hypothetical protein